MSFPPSSPQIAQGESNSWRIRFWNWVTDYWNMVDIATLVLFTIGVVLRFFDQLLDYARIILAIDLAIFYIRILHIFSVNKNLGPKLIMIAKMVRNLALVCILSQSSQCGMPHVAKSKKVS